MLFFFSGARNTLKYIWKGQAESAKGSERTQLFHFDRYQLHFHRSASNYAWAQRADTLRWVLFLSAKQWEREENDFFYDSRYNPKKLNIATKNQSKKHIISLLNFLYSTREFTVFVFRQ